MSIGALGTRVLGGSFVGVALIGAALPVDEALRIDFGHRFSPPDALHWLGTDALGRDMARRLVLATWINVEMAGVSAAVALGLGRALGAAARRFPQSLGRLITVLAYVGYVLPALLLRPSWKARVAMALFAVCLALPGFVAAIAMVALFGPGRMVNSLVVGALLAPAAAYIIHREGQERVGGANRVSGVEAAWRQATLAMIVASLFAWAFCAQMSLDGLGLGVQPPLPGVGQILVESAFRNPGRPWPALALGLFIVLAVTGSFALGKVVETRARKIG
jgi:peptide/nickel transport system permease protein